MLSVWLKRTRATLSSSAKFTFGATLPTGSAFASNEKWIDKKAIVYLILNGTVARPEQRRELCVALHSILLLLFLSWILFYTFSTLTEIQAQDKLGLDSLDWACCWCKCESRDRWTHHWMWLSEQRFRSALNERFGTHFNRNLFVIQHSTVVDVWTTWENTVCAIVSISPTGH